MAFQKGHKINKGRKLTKEQRDKIGLFQKGKVVSKETKKKIGNFQRGKIVSSKTREKLRIKAKEFFSNQTNRDHATKKAKEQWQKSGFKEKISLQRKGRIITPEWRNNLSQSLKGRLGRRMSEEELIFTALAELSTRRIAETDETKGLEENKIPAIKGGRIAKDARLALEEKTGKSVITGENYLPKKKSSKSLT